MTQSQFESPMMPTEIADAPDIENVPAASSMHALMDAVVQIHHGMRQIQEHLGLANQPDPERKYKPGTVAVVVKSGDPGAGIDDAEFRASVNAYGIWTALDDDRERTAAPLSVRPLVLIDPTEIDILAVLDAAARAWKSATNDSTPPSHLGSVVADVLSVLGIEAS